MQAVTAHEVSRRNGSVPIALVINANLIFLPWCKAWPSADASLARIPPYTCTTLTLFTRTYGVKHARRMPLPGMSALVATHLRVGAPAQADGVLDDIKDIFFGLRRVMEPLVLLTLALIAPLCCLPFNPGGPGQIGNVRASLRCGPGRTSRRNGFFCPIILTCPV